MPITEAGASPGKTGKWARCLLFVLAALATAPAMGTARMDTSGKIRISTLSNRPDKLSGDQVLVAVHVPQAVGLDDVTVKLNGSDATSVFAPEAGTRRLVGLVTGLGLGKNALTASAKRTGSARQEARQLPDQQTSIFGAAAKAVLLPNG